MLVVLGDLHLTDEWTAVNVHPDVFAGLENRLVKVAAESRFAREIEFVLLGDVYDLVRTDYWLREAIAPEDRPWGCPEGHALDPETGMNPDLPAVEAQFSRILADILARPAAEALASTLRRVSQRSGLPARATYVVGNHDRVLWNFPSLQRQVAAALAPLEIAFATECRRERFGALARHGHEWDDHCHGWRFLVEVLRRGSAVERFDPVAYRVMAIGEPITAELMGGLIRGVRERLDPDDTADWAFLNALADLNNVRPFTSVLHWIGWFGQQREQRYLDVCIAAMRESLDRFLESALVRQWDRMGRLELLEALRLVRVLLKAPDPLQTVRKLLDVATREASAIGAGGAHRRGAARDFADLGGAYRYVLYGHTHVARTESLAGGAPDRGRTYVNTGTWLPLIERARDGRSYYHSHRPTCAFLVKDGAGSPAFDVWNGGGRRRFADDVLRRC